RGFRRARSSHCGRPNAATRSRGPSAVLRPRSSGHGRQNGRATQALAPRPFLLLPTDGRLRCRQLRHRSLLRRLRISTYLPSLQSVKALLLVSATRPPPSPSYLILRLQQREQRVTTIRSTEASEAVLEIQ